MIILVSVIIPTLEAGSYISHLIMRLKSQSITPFEIIIIDSSSRDQTVNDAIQCGSKVISVEKSTFDHGGTRNLAASQAQGDVLVFLTQDALPEIDTFIEELISPFSDPKVAAACGRQVARPEATPIERMTREFNYPVEPRVRSIEDVHQYGIKTFFFTDVCSAIRKDVFDSIGGFPEPIILNEDMLYAAKCLLQGYSIAYAPKATVLHSHHYTLRQEFKRNFDIGVSLRMNDWLLQYATPEGEGLRLVKAQFRSLCKPKLWVWIPRWVAETVAKYAGYRLGLSYKKLPAKVVKKCSMHRSFWQKNQSILQ